MKIVEKKEFTIGEEFRFGLIKLKCVIAPEKADCGGCIIGDSDINCSYFIGYCTEEERSDKTDVIFIKA